MDVIKELAIQPGQEDPFYILDVGDIVQKIKIWKLKLPRIKPFYAVKCNDNPMVLEILAALGIGFDCASKAEIQKVLQIGVDPSRIIYAHPCKPVSHLRVASKFNVPLMTFDNETELYKIKAYYPEAQLVIRIRCDAVDALCPLGIKFGVLPSDALALLSTAQILDLNVVGVSFHVGSGCREPAAFHRAIAAAKEVFDKAETLGFNPTLLDIGGGFPGNHNSSLDELADCINNALDEFFPEDSGVKVIAEPGRYVVASAFTLATNIVAKREVFDDNGSHVSSMYYVNDGVYGSFNCVIFDHSTVHPVLMKEPAEHETYIPCSIWGPTCDGLDQIVSEIKLPPLSCGEWLIWPDMGAYSLATANTFNGFPLPKVHVVVPHHTWLYLEQHLGSTINFTPIDGTSVVEEHLGSTINFAPVDETSVVDDCSSADKQEAEDSVSSPNPAYLTCAATSFDSTNLEEQLAKLTFIDVGEM